jgi:hypothetical protein
MAETNPAAQRNVQRQLAIFEVASRARGKSMAEIKQMLREAFARRRLPGQPGTWLDSVASEASYGEPYIVDLSAAETADSMEQAPDARVHRSLAWRRQLWQLAGRSAGAGRPDDPAQPGRRAGRARRRAVPITNEGLAAVRAIVAGAIALTAALAVVMAVRMVGRRRRLEALASPLPPAP